jgi:hypothetical protein
VYLKKEKRMIQWVHAGVGVLTLLILCIFLIVYIGIFSASTKRICGAPLEGQQGPRGAPGARGKAIAPGPIGPQSTVPGPTGRDGPDALGILTGPSPLPAGTGFYTGSKGNTGWPGPTPDLLNPIGAPPINFRFLNNGIGSDLDKYDDTGYFTVAVSSNTGVIPTLPVSVRFVRLGKTVVFQAKQIIFTHGGAQADWINFYTPDFNFPIQSRFFFVVSPYASTPYIMAQELIVFDQVQSNFTNGLFRLEIVPDGTPIGKINSMRIQFQAQYSPEADAGLFPPQFNAQFSSKFQPGTGTFGTASDIAITWTLE